MKGRMTNNGTKFREELIAKLQADHEGSVLMFSCVHSLLLEVYAIFILRDDKTGRTFVLHRSREQAINHPDFHPGLFFPDEITFREKYRELNAEEKAVVHAFLHADTKAPEPFKGILLDGFNFSLKFVGKENIKEYDWIHNSQPDETTLKFIDFLGSIG